MIKSIRHLRASKNLPLSQQTIIKWRELVRKKLGVYESIVNISILFSKPTKN